MSLLVLASLAVSFVAIAMVELRAVHAGDERGRHEVGYWTVMGGLVFIAVGFAAAVSDHAPFTLLFSAAGLVAVIVGGARHREAALH